VEDRPLISRRVLVTAIYFLLLPTPPTLVCAAAHSAQQSAAPKLEVLAGNYSNPAEPSGGYTICVEDGKLILESTATVPTELVPVSATVFSVPRFDTNI
jgi:hypothetical protein